MNTLPEDRDDRQPYLFVGADGVLVRNLGALVGCALPLLLFWAGFLLCGALTGW